jgi:hypothetical protein
MLKGKTSSEIHMVRLRRDISCSPRSQKIKNSITVQQQNKIDLGEVALTGERATALEGSLKYDELGIP